MTIFKQLRGKCHSRGYFTRAGKYCSSKNTPIKIFFVYKSYNIKIFDIKKSTCWQLGWFFYIRGPLSDRKIPVVSPHPETTQLVPSVTSVVCKQAGMMSSLNETGDLQTWNDRNQWGRVTQYTMDLIHGKLGNVIQ